MKRNILYAVLQLKLAETLQKSTVLLTDNISSNRIRDVLLHIKLFRIFKAITRFKERCYFD